VPKAAKPAQVAAEVADAAQAPEGIPFPTEAAVSEAAISGCSSANENVQVARRLTDSAVQGVGPSQASSEAALACGVSEASVAADEFAGQMLGTLMRPDDREATATMCTQVSDVGLSAQGLNVMPQVRPDSALSKFSANSDPPGKIQDMIADMVHGMTTELSQEEARSLSGAPPITLVSPKTSSPSQVAQPAHAASEATKEDSHDVLDLTFDLEYHKVDHSAFKQELYNGLVDLGVKKASLAVVDVALREGSTIAELRGPHFAIQEIRGKDLSALQVMGKAAQVDPFPFP
jgi:hypothetical protein